MPSDASAPPERGTKGGLNCTWGPYLVGVSENQGTLWGSVLQANTTIWGARLGVSNFRKPPFSYSFTSSTYL